MTTIPKYALEKINYHLKTMVLGKEAQWVRRREQRTDRDEKQQRRDPLVFIEDNILLPPLGWTLIWGGTYSNLYGYHIENTVRRWGYVVWDASRYEDTRLWGALMDQLNWIHRRRGDARDSMV
jgi:hypothetical protein